MGSLVVEEAWVDSHKINCNIMKFMKKHNHRFQKNLPRLSEYFSIGETQLSISRRKRRIVSLFKKLFFFLDKLKSTFGKKFCFPWEGMSVQYLSISTGSLPGLYFSFLKNKF